jgi:colicin import membrane protein
MEDKVMTKIQECQAALKQARARHAAEIKELQAAIADAKAERKAKAQAKAEATEQARVNRAKAKADKAGAAQAKANARMAKARELEELAIRARAFKDNLAREMASDPSGQSESAKMAGAQFNEAKAEYKAAR